MPGAWRRGNKVRTSFSIHQLADPDFAASEAILRNCVHCGFCTATCPTYLLLGDELDSPRGRIYLIKDMLEGGAPVTSDVVKHVDRCLSCLSCMTTCPASVHYMHLVDHGRAHIEQHYRRPLLDRLARGFLAAMLPNPHLFRWAAFAGLLARPFLPLLRAMPGMGRVAAMVELAPRRVPARAAFEGAGLFAAQGQRRGRVALMSGCAHPVLRPDINERTIALLNRHGIEVVLAEGEDCCGALEHHMGRRDAAHRRAKRNIDAWTRELDGAGLDAIIVNVSGCGTVLKDYGYMLRNDPAYAQKAARISSLARDITEFMGEIGFVPARKLTGTVAYHSACSMQHGQQITALPKDLLAATGLSVRDVPEGHICCGSAGTYNMLQPELSQRLRARKVANIERIAPHAVAAGNLGCMTQIAAGTDLPMVHTVELLDWASGGERPEALRDSAVLAVADAPRAD